jgi:hypothetical protein
VILALRRWSTLDLVEQIGGIRLRGRAWLFLFGRRACGFCLPQGIAGFPRSNYFRCCRRVFPFDALGAGRTS